jgi:hypothetical protein
MTKNTNIIILSDVPPDPKYTAGQVLHQAIAGLADFRFRFYWLNQSRLDTRVELPANCTQVAILGTAYGRSIGFLVGACNHLMHRLPSLSRPLVLIKCLLACASLITRAVKLGWRLRRDPGTVIWFVIQGERLVIVSLIASWLARKPYLLQQWDPLSWWMGHRQYPRRVMTVAQRLLSQLEQRARVNIVPSDVWREQLAAQGKTAIRLDNFIQQPLLQETRFLAIRDPRALHAVFVGQFYAGNELIRTVSTLAASVQKNGRELVIHLFGSSDPVSLDGCQVISHGLLDRDELIRRISKWDLALLPYPTAAGHEETARLSFPSKARVYLAAGLPILACAPVFSGVHRFLDQHYPNHYFNVEVMGDANGFVKDLLDASYQTRQARFRQARQLVGSLFSDTAELLPLRDILGDAA